MSKLPTSDIEFELNQKRQEKKRLMREVDETDTVIGHLKLELEKRKEVERRAVQATHDAQRMLR